MSVVPGFSPADSETMKYTFVVLLALFSAIGACSGPAPKAPAPLAAAHVENPVVEAGLTSVTLTAEAEKRLAIETVPVTMEQVAGTRTIGGEVVVPPGRAVTVTAPVAGTLVAPPGAAPQPGTRVRRGQRIFGLLPLLPGDRDLRIEADRAMAASTAELEAARQRRQRLEQLLKEGAASLRAVEEARAQEAVATASVEAAKSRLGVANRNSIGSQGEMSIEAPLEGVLKAVHTAPGQAVASSAPLFEVIAVDTVWIRVPVYAGELADVDPAQPAAVSSLSRGGSTAAPSQAAQRIAAPPSADASTAAVDLFYALPNTTGFRPGERVSVALPLRAGEAALVVPEAAVLYDTYGGTWVYEARPNHVYVRRRIEVAGHLGPKVKITRGPAKGTSVVTIGAAELFGTEFGAGH